MAESVANDHVPLAFLLGARASRYGPKARTNTPGATGLTTVGPTLPGSRKHSKLRGTERSSLFPLDSHPRVREEEARRVLQQTLLAHGTADAVGHSLGPHVTATSTPTSILRAQKEFVMCHVLELRGADDCVEPTDLEPQHRRGGDDTVNNDDREPRPTGFRGYERTDRDTAFLDVAGRAPRIPLLSTHEAKQLHHRVMERQSERRAHRADEMHALLHDQQQLTKRMLRSGSHSTLGRKLLARVDLSVNVDTVEGSEPALHSADPRDEPTADDTTTTTSQLPLPLAVMREQQAIEHQQHCERIQERRHMDLLTRQQKLAFYQELRKREMAGRALNSSRPSFLATLQLDKTGEWQPGGPKTTAPLGVTKPAHAKLNQVEESEDVLRKLQREVFRESDDGGKRLLFGGGFKPRRAPSRSVESACVNHLSGPTASTFPPKQPESAVLTTHSVAISKKPELERPQRRRRRLKGSSR